MFKKFLSPGEGQGGDSGGSQTPNAGGEQNQQTAAIDYGKIQQMLDGTLKAKEDTALKAYFKQQGLSQQEAESAIAAFKQQKAENQPDVSALQNEAAAARQQAREAQIQAAATMAAVSLGIAANTIPYVLKMADLSQVTGQDGAINKETLTEALKKVLEDVPALKPQASSGSGGFTQVGTGGSPLQQAQQSAATQQTPATKRWNRWN